MYKVQVTLPDFMRAAYVYVGKKMGDKLYVAQPLPEMVFREHDITEISKPTLILPIELSEEMVRAFTEAGIKPEKLSALLDSTKEALAESQRRILKMEEWMSKVVEKWTSKVVDGNR